MAWYDDAISRLPGQGRDPNSFGARLERALGAGVRSVGQLGGGLLGLGTGIVSGLRAAGPRQISGNAMPAPNFAQDSFLDDNPFRNPMGDSFGDGLSSTDQILQQLMALTNAGQYMADEGSLRAQARAAAAAQYGPVIAALRNQQNSARTRGERNKEALGVMFGQLSDSIRGDLPRVEGQYNQTMADTAGQYKQLESSISGQYEQSQKEQEEMYKRLNIEAAAPDVLPQQQRDRDFFLNSARTSGQTQQNALTTEKQGAVDYTNKGVQMAKNEGTQRQADLMMQLQDLMAQFDAQIGANQAAQSQAESAGFMSLQSQAQQAAQRQAQQNFENFIAATNLGRNMRGDQLDELVKLSQLNKGTESVRSLNDVAGRALSLGMPQRSAQSLQNVFGSALNDSMIQAGMDANTGSPLSAEAKAARIVEQGRQQGLSAQELNALMAMALEYFGRR